MGVVSSQSASYVVEINQSRSEHSAADRSRFVKDVLRLRMTYLGNFLLQHLQQR